ncbi:uncharacterized protein [Phaseolus vulgaris]|uniref:uncharacterized protein n=1 Tax=Phaseolus vulgaris TaxID=3885 RepID=UPI0035C96F8A
MFIHLLCAYMPKPKRIKNLLKSVAGSDKSVANYVNINATPSTTQDQTRTTSASPFGSPLPQASQSIHQQTSQPTQSQTSQVPQSQASQVPQPQTEYENLESSESVPPATSESAPAQPTSESERVQPRKSRQSNHYWFVDAIDGEGVSQKLKVKVRDAHNLPTGLRVVVNYDDNFQPIGEASGLLAGVCGQLAANHVLFPISFEKWSTLPDTYKDTVWESALKSRFCFKVNEDLAKRDVMFKIGKLWREYRCKLWNEFYDPLMSRSDLIKNVPTGLNMEQWVVFVDYRLRPSTVNMCNRNRDIRKRQIIPHTGGAMSLSRRRNNLKIETGKNIGRAEMWKITHKRKNGIYVNEEALEIGEKIDELMLTNPKGGSNISPEDPIGVIFGKEHPDRVRGLSYGACPSLAFKGSTTRLSGMNHASSSSTSSNVEDKITQMENELATVKNQMNTLLAYIASRKDVPEHFAAIAANLVHASTNEASDYGSGAPSPNQVIGSSAESKTD